MTDSDELFLTAAKLREQVLGNIDGKSRFHPHAGMVSDSTDRSVLSFVEDSLEDPFEDSKLGSVVTSKFLTDEATEAVHSADGATLSHLVGVTEQDLEASALTLSARLLDHIDNNGALTTILAAGQPNTGKTNTMAVLAELANVHYDDLLVISNVRSWELTEEIVTSAHGLATTLLENRERPKFVLVDEGSTHFDARTSSYEVATQWSPLQKRMSKVGTEVVGVIGHTGKDVDPEAKRLTNLAYWKEEPDEVDFFEEWPADSDRPDGQLFGGTLTALEATATTYNPDDAASWSWNLEPELFSKDLGWSELLDLLHERGPAE
jgi:hypothetical protein